MANTRVGDLREIIKEVIGKERYRNLLIFVDKQKAGHRFKIIGGLIELPKVRNLRLQKICLRSTALR